MPEITLKYSAEDEDAYLAALHGIDFYCALHDLDQWLRSKIKHEDKEEFEPVRDQLHECVANRGINLDILS